MLSVCRRRHMRGRTEVIFFFKDVGIALGSGQVHLHSAAGFFRITLTDGAINSPMLPKSSFRNSGHFVGAAADLAQWRRDGFEHHDGKRILGSRGDCFMKADISIADPLIKKHVTLPSAAIHSQRIFLLPENCAHGFPICVGGFLGGQADQSQFEDFAEFDQRLGLLHESRSRKIFGIDKRGVIRLEDDSANLRLYADQLERFKRLDGFTNASAADGEFFGQLLFGGKSLARLDLTFFDEVKDVVDDLGSNGLLADQAVILQSN